MGATPEVCVDINFSGDTQAVIDVFEVFRGMAARFQTLVLNSLDYIRYSLSDFLRIFPYQLILYALGEFGQLPQRFFQRQLFVHRRALLFLVQASLAFQRRRLVCFVLNDMSLWSNELRRSVAS